MAIQPPPSLYLQEWFRPRWAIPAGCLPSQVDQNSVIAQNFCRNRPNNNAIQVTVSLSFLIHSQFLVPTALSRVQCTQEAQ
jgi:hypothetical protein